MPSARKTTKHARTRRDGFTLVELLVVIAVIGLLISVLLPALQGARSAARAIVGASIQRQIGIGAIQYAGENDQFYPGINSSGRMMRNAGPNADYEAWNRSGTAPVQTWDFITPSLGGESLPPNREERMYKVFEEFADPAQTVRAPVWESGPGAGVSEAAAYANQVGQAFRGASYLMSSTFQLYGKNNPALDPTSTLPPDRFGWGTNSGEAECYLPDNKFAPRLDRVTSDKVFIADGFRYIGDGGNEIDFDASVFGYSHGAFTDLPPSSRTSRAWGNEQGQPSGGPDGTNLPLSYRHVGNSMNVTMFDGSGKRISESDSRNPALWAPRGYTVRVSRLHPQARNFGYEEGDPVN